MKKNSKTLLAAIGCGCLLANIGLAATTSNDIAQMQLLIDKYKNMPQVAYHNALSFHNKTKLAYSSVKNKSGMCAGTIGPMFGIKGFTNPGENLAIDWNIVTAICGGKFPCYATFNLSTNATEGRNCGGTQISASLDNNGQAYFIDNGTTKVTASYQTHNFCVSATPNDISTTDGACA